MAWSFIKHITDYMSRPRLGNQKAPTLWPSEASMILENEYGEKENIGKCRRAIFFRYLKDNYIFSEKYSHYKSLIEEIDKHGVDVDPYIRWIWVQGNLYEDYLLNKAKESGVYIGDQTQVYIPKYNVSGKIDIIVINPETSKLSISEPLACLSSAECDNWRNQLRKLEKQTHEYVSNGRKYNQPNTRNP